MEGRRREFVRDGGESGLPTEAGDEEGGVRGRGDLRQGISHLRTSQNHQGSAGHSLFVMLVHSLTFMRAIFLIWIRVLLACSRLFNVCVFLAHHLNREFSSFTRIWGFFFLNLMVSLRMGVIFHRILTFYARISVIRDDLRCARL